MDNKLKCLDLVSVYLSICLSVYPSHSPLKLKQKCSDLVSVYLSIYLFVYLSICLSVSLSTKTHYFFGQFTANHLVEGGLYVYLYVYIPVCLSICLSVCLYICPSECLSICLSICLSLSLSVCIPIHLYKYKCRNIALWKNEKEIRKKKRKVQNKLFIQI